MKLVKIVILPLLFTVQAQAAETPLDSQEPEIEAADRARLESALLQIDAAEASNRLSAVQEIVHQAGQGATLPAVLRRLLVRATADQEPALAALATRALNRHEYPPKPEQGSDAEIRASAEAGRLKWAREILSQIDATEPKMRSASDRLAAAHVMVHLASSKGDWSADLEWLVREARRDSDSQVAHLAEKVLARHEGRPMNPDFLLPNLRSQEPSEPSPEYRNRADEMYAGANAPNADTRLSGLRWVVDIAFAEGLDSDSRILDTLIGHRSDPDPRISHFVRFALAGLTGDQNAMREVYVDR